MVLTCFFKLVASYSVAALAAQGTGKFLSSNAYDTASNTLVVTSPTDGALQHGLIGFHVNQDCKLSKSFDVTATTGVYGEPYSSPTLANGVIYYSDGPGGHVYAASAMTGATLWSTASVGGWVVGAPTVVNGRVYISSFNVASYGSSTALSYAYAFALP